MNVIKQSLYILLVATMCLAARAADSPSPSDEEAYQSYLKRNQELNEVYHREGLVISGILFVFLGGLIAFVLLPVARRSRRAVELAESQQKTLEEIRDLLKKQ